MIGRGEGRKDLMTPNREENLLIRVLEPTGIICVAKQGTGDDPMRAEAPEVRDVKMEKW